MLAYSILAYSCTPALPCFCSLNMVGLGVDATMVASTTALTVVPKKLCLKLSS